MSHYVLRDYGTEVMVKPVKVKALKSNLPGTTGTSTRDQIQNQSVLVTTSKVAVLVHEVEDWYVTTQTYQPTRHFIAIGSVPTYVHLSKNLDSD